jgi:prophage antirepressor-like protein
MLTTQINNSKRIPSNDSLGESRIVSGIFYRQNSRKGITTPVSVYREVCGDFPKGVVDNTGAFLMSKESHQNITLGGSKMSNSQIVPFSFNSHKIRVVERDGEAWFLLSDVCSALGLTNTTRVASRLDDDERANFKLGLNIPNANIVNESGLYAVILRSDKPEAKTFRKWVTSEVLPAIRKTGTYGKHRHIPQIPQKPQISKPSNFSSGSWLKLDNGRQFYTKEFIAKIFGNLSFITAIIERGESIEFQGDKYYVLDLVRYDSALTLIKYKVSGEYDLVKFSYAN